MSTSYPIYETEDHLLDLDGKPGNFDLDFSCEEGYWTIASGLKTENLLQIAVFILYVATLEMDGKAFGVDWINEYNKLKENE